MHDFNKISTTNRSRERPSEGGLYRTEGRTIRYSAEVAKKLEEALKLLLEQIKEEKKR